MQPLMDQLKPTAGLGRGDAREEVLNFNNRFLKSNRKGEYLIKHNDQFFADMGVGYVNYTFTGKEREWVKLSSRKNAQWFTKEEIKELQPNKYGLYKAIKR